MKGSQGGELHLLEWSTEGVPMLLLHGFGNEAHIWDDFAPIVAPHYRTLALDHRGHGQSGWDLEGRYAIDHLVDDVETVTDFLAVDGWAHLGAEKTERLIELVTPLRERVLDAGVLPDWIRSRG